VIEVPVLIVGGGPVGLTASIMLARHGVPSHPRDAVTVMAVPDAHPTRRQR